MRERMTGPNVTRYQPMNINWRYWSSALRFGTKTERADWQTDRQTNRQTDRHREREKRDAARIHNKEASEATSSIAGGVDGSWRRMGGRENGSGVGEERVSSQERMRGQQPYDVTAAAAAMWRIWQLLTFSYSHHQQQQQHQRMHKQQRLSGQCVHGCDVWLSSSSSSSAQ